MHVNIFSKSPKKIHKKLLVGSSSGKWIQRDNWRGLGDMYF